MENYIQESIDANFSAKFISNLGILIAIFVNFLLLTILGSKFSENIFGNFSDNFIIGITGLFFSFYSLIEFKEKILSIIGIILNLIPMVYILFLFYK